MAEGFFVPACSCSLPRSYRLGTLCAWINPAHHVPTSMTHACALQALVRVSITSCHATAQPSLPADIQAAQDPAVALPEHQPVSGGQNPMPSQASLSTHTYAVAAGGLQSPPPPAATSTQPVVTFGLTVTPQGSLSRY